MSDETHSRAGSGRSENGLDPAVQSDHPKGGANRRRLLKGGVTAAPFVFTLMNRPALAAPLCSVAIMLSATPSAKPLTCFPNGPTPGNWKNLVGAITRKDWYAAGADPGGCTKKRSKWTCTPSRDGAGLDYYFSDVFEGGMHGKKGLREVMLTEPSSAGNHAVAAWLNAKRFPDTYSLTPEQVLNAYNAFLGRELTRSEFREFIELTLA